MRRMGAGLLRRRIVVQKRTVANNAIGEPVETWSRHLKTPAQVVTRGGRESFREDREQARDMITFRVRWTASREAWNAADYRVLYPSTDGEPYDIESVQDVEGRRRYLDIMCNRNE